MPEIMPETNPFLSSKNCRKIAVFLSSKNAGR